MIEVTPIAHGLLDPNPWNPNVMQEHVLQAARESIQRFGMIDPVVVRKKGRTRFEIIDGEHRWKASDGLVDPVPCVIVKAGDAEARKMTVILNDIKGRHDTDLLGALLRELHIEMDADEFAIAMPYTDAELSALLDSVAPPILPTADDAPSVPEVADSKIGDVYQLGRHMLACGDATDPDVYTSLLGAMSASSGTLVDQVGMIFTDPPYGVDYQSRGRAMTANKSYNRTMARAGEEAGILEVPNDALGDDGTRALVGDALAVASALLRPGGSFYVCSPPGITEGAFRAALADVGLELRQNIAWVKDQFVLGRQDYHWQHESILYGWKAGAAHHFLADRTQTTVWEIPRPQRSDEHPTMKPVELVARAIANSSLVDDVILDPFAGSGTTMIAAESLGRTAALIELDPRYCDVIRRRYEEHTAR